MQTWEIIEIISIIFSIPVLALAYYDLFLIINAFRYPLDMEKETPFLHNYPLVTILIATYNEKYVIEKSLLAIEKSNYPHNRLQVVVADDSTDDTLSVIDSAISVLNSSGIESMVSRRPDRENFKSGALNNAFKYVKGEYVLLLDADSRIQEDTVSKGVHTLQTHSDASFVSFRVGHYNRYSSPITMLYALNQDLWDTQTKMGSYASNLPYSFQGGFTMLRADKIREVGLWANDTITEDADLSWRLYLHGTRGIYLSNARIMSEDPSTLETWKKQNARVQQGWSRLELKLFRKTLQSKETSWRNKFLLLLIFMSPFSNLSWIITNFLSAMALVLGWSAPGNSIFSSYIYITIITVPLGVFYLSGIYAFLVQKILTLRNLIIIPLLSYTTACMVTRSAIGFVEGIAGRRGVFFRTPKRGEERTVAETKYYRDIKLERATIIEGVISVVGLILGVFALLYGVWVLGLSLIGFSVLTLKSMNLSRLFSREKDATTIEEARKSINNAMEESKTSENMDLAEPSRTLLK